ncbi:YhcH/YjgK/YiaL family protein [Clostridium algifaecis]|uniref:YhcH/YjgK/YiaL family protein n=1 Tax=Clostridium algifaecis TaxID=1472040 RepID=A0ABS4KUZ9_9CLOT|nr:YhcH/YjgK/YiaL family protein [Clostridium algifaecis]MBP2033867.1 YhcH/YjgK/YiaL family protein [Clostridium algifaecis]
MILDKLENAHIYFSLNDKFKKAFKFLMDNDIEKLDDGRYEIDSDEVFAFVQSYTTKSEHENKWESHEKYIDIQYIEKGEETIGWTPVNQLVIDEEYLKDKDIVFYNATSQRTKLNLNDKYFGIFFPKDAHKPGCIFNKPTKIKKVVIKVKM